MWIVEAVDGTVTVAEQNGFKSEAHCLTAIKSFQNDPDLSGLSFRHYFRKV